MSSDVVRKNAWQRRAALARELSRLDDFLALYDELSGSGVTVPVGPNPTQASTETCCVASQVEEDLGPTLDAGKRAKPAEVVARVRALLDQAAKPMVRAELARQLASEGMTLAGADPARYVGSTLWRYNDVVVHLDGHGYWPRERPYEPAGYVPTPAARRAGRRAQD